MFEFKPFPKEDEERIVAAIKEAETNTSGEIRVHVEKHCKSDAFSRAVHLFEKLGMHKTAARNGVLVYVAIADHKFAIVGDQGINEAVPPGFWEQTKDLMRQHFAEGRFAEGVIEGARDAGQQLKAHFPYHHTDSNELTNQISFGNDA